MVGIVAKVRFICGLEGSGELHEKFADTPSFLSHHSVRQVQHRDLDALLGSECFLVNDVIPSMVHSSGKGPEPFLFLQLISFRFMQLPNTTDSHPDPLMENQGQGGAPQSSGRAFPTRCSVHLSIFSIFLVI